MHRVVNSAAACLAGLVASCGTPAHEAAEPATASAVEQPAPKAIRGGVHPWCSASAVSPSLRITADSIGPARVGMSRAALQRDCPTARDTTAFDAEGTPLAASTLTFAGREVGVAEWSAQGALERIQVQSPLAVTDRGLRVGSTVGDLRKAYPRLAMGYDDAGVHAWSEEEEGLSYLLDVRVTELLPSPDDVAARPEVVPDSSRVRAILLVSRDRP